jgi:hypothetical protein
MVWRPSDTCGSASTGIVEKSTPAPWYESTISGTPEGTVEF